MSSLPLEFRQSLSEKYRPRRIGEFAGLEKQKKILSRFAASPHPSAWLFVGPSGVGKTTMALALAEEIACEVHHIPSRKCDLQTVENVTRQCWYAPWVGKKFHLILVDEADAMTEAAQLAFLSKLDATDFPPRTIFILTANSTDRLEKRFLSRCRVFEFSNYGMAPATTELLEKIWTREAGQAPKPNFARIVKESCNNVRDALMTLEMELLSI